MLLDLVRYVCDSTTPRRIILAAILLSGGAPFIGCAVGTYDIGGVPSGGGGDDPPVSGVHDSNFHAGATVSLRTPAAGGNGVTLFARTGVLAPIDASSSAAFALNPPPVAATGTVTHQEYVTVPLYGGITVPAKNIGVPIPNLAFEAFGGANIKNEKFGFSLTQADGGVAAASQTYWAANPAAGAGIQYNLGTFNGVQTSLGAAVIVDFQLRNYSVTAPSPTVAGLSYPLANPAHPNETAAFTLNFDLPPK